MRRPHSVIRLRLQELLLVDVHWAWSGYQQERRVHFKGYFDALFIFWRVLFILPFLLNPCMLCSIRLTDNLG